MVPATKFCGSSHDATSPCDLLQGLVPDRVGRPLWPARALRLGHKSRRKNSVCNLQYGPRARLVRGIYNPPNLFDSLTHNWPKCTAKTEEYPRLYPNFQNCKCCEKSLKDNKHNSLHLTWTLSAPPSSQFSSSYALRKLFASQNR